MLHTLWEKKVFCNWPSNSISKLHSTLATHCIYMLWVLLDKLYKNCKSCNLSYIQCNSLQLNYNFVTTTPFQLLCNSPMITIIKSCWCHFSSIHQILTHDTIKIFRDFFKILISIFHYDYSFRLSWIMTRGTIKSCHIAYLIKFWIYIGT